MKLDAKDIGNRVKAIRLSEKKSQETFAETIDTSSRTVSNIENGSVIPTLQTVAKPSYQEVVAESFSEWYNSNNPRRFCEDFLKEVGYI